MQGIQTPPRTIMEVFKSLPEGTLAELIDGTLHMSSIPTPRYQRIIGELAFALSSHMKQNNSGEILFAPCDVFLDEHSNAVQPDVIFISSKNSTIVGEDAIHGVPDMLIEVLSPGNPKHDLVRKKELYQKFGVKEYWIIDPDTKESLGFTLKDGIFKEAGTYKAKIKSLLLNQDFAF